MPHDENDEGIHLYSMLYPVKYIKQKLKDHLFNLCTCQIQLDMLHVGCKQIRLYVYTTMCLHHVP